MKINLRKMIIYYLIGVGFGGLIYIVSLWSVSASQQAVGQITNVVLLSGLIGLISMIFESDSLPFTVQLVIHFVLVYAVILLMNWLGSNDVLWNWLFFGNFILTYLVVWAVVYYTFYRRVSNINRKLAEKKRSKP